MQLTSPPPDGAATDEWWLPLRLLGVQLVERRLETRFREEHFWIAGRRDRAGLEPVFVYAHLETGTALYVGPAGNPYRLGGNGQLYPCPLERIQNPYPPRGRVVRRGRVVLEVIDGELVV